MKNLFFLITLYLLQSFSFHQTDSIVYDEKGNLRCFKSLKIKKDPNLSQWTGVENEVLEYAQQNIVYPQPLLDAGVMGMTITEIIVLKNGSFKINVIKSIGGGADEALHNGLKNMPNTIIEKLRPEKKKQAVYYLPVLFNLSNKTLNNCVVIKGLD